MLVKGIKETNKKGKIATTIASEYSLRNWIEYGFEQVKNELGWADFRVTGYHSIERWWELGFIKEGLLAK